MKSKMLCIEVYFNTFMNPFYKVVIGGIVDSK